MDARPLHIRFNNVDRIIEIYNEIIDVITNRKSIVLS